MTFVVQRNATKERCAFARCGDVSFDVTVVTAKHEPRASSFVVFASPHSALLDRADAIGRTAARFLEERNFVAPQAAAVAARVGFAVELQHEAVVAPRHRVEAEATVLFLARVRVWHGEHVLHRQFGAVVRRHEARPRGRVLGRKDDVAVLRHCGRVFLAGKVLAAVVWVDAVERVAREELAAIKVAASAQVEWFRHWHARLAVAVAHIALIVARRAEHDALAIEARSAIAAAHVTHVVDTRAVWHACAIQAGRVARRVVGRAAHIAAIVVGIAKRSVGAVETRRTVAAAHVAHIVRGGASDNAAAIATALAVTIAHVARVVGRRTERHAGAITARGAVTGAHVTHVVLG